ncbi:XPG domain containing-domain-containing protein [Aspergillus foveolatus]|uniref:XPG domain containing-domain-containing protein n=1 Tax=Aspergillus foveolatus TaxID=210207 RepID=UPI003CCCCF12
MGIPRVRRHLTPFCQTVLLQSGADADFECIKSVVIDGPSLVYNVYARLLSWFLTTSSNTFDALPTCDEVSRGVMLYLMHLKMLGVEIESIYFDGALPVHKRETRVARLENQRNKLELFCAETRNGFDLSKPPVYNRTIKPDNVLRSRPTPAKYGNIPANPFMVSAVFEDLKCRWNRANILDSIRDTLPLHTIDIENLPWASVTTMVSGEADAYCASVARRMGACILTNDSDLLLYDLGKYGSVVFLDSVELQSGFEQPLFPQIKATMLRPSLVARRLGIPNLLLLAFQISKSRPETSLVELLRRTKMGIAEVEMTRYQQFASEYQSDHLQMQAQGTKELLEIIDTRISELFWQYEMRSEYTDMGYPHVYLSVLNEDHTRKCAWAKGREYRQLAYSIMNLSRPIDERHCFIAEFVRRGRRITEDKLKLLDEGSISAELELLQARLETLQSSFKKSNDNLDYWAAFALCDVYLVADAELAQNDFQKLEQSVKHGYIGKRLKWEDIHLTAQMHAVLYSLRILKQILDLFYPRDVVVLNLRAILDKLPPLHIMMDPASRRAEVYLSILTTAQLSDCFGRLVQRRQSDYTTNTGTETAKRELRSFLHVGTTEQGVGDCIPSHASNIYELLQEE